MRLAKMRVAGLYGYMATSPPTPPSSCRDVFAFCFFRDVWSPYLTLIEPNWLRIRYTSHVSETNEWNWAYQCISKFAPTVSL